MKRERRRSRSDRYHQLSGARRLSLRRDQRGAASLIISMISMVIISLIVIGFATIARREERQSLDQQLSTQAFYAAESGVEDAKSVIRGLLAANPNQEIPAKPDCTTDPAGKYPTGTKTIVDATYNVSYTCLTVDPSPTSLQFNGVGEHSVVVPINTDNPINSVRLTWTPTSTPSMPATGCPNTLDKTLRQQPNWNCGYGMLRMDLTPTDSSGGPLSRTNMVGTTVTGFFEPLTGNNAGTLNYNTSMVKANLVAAKCDTAGGTYGKCEMTVNNISGNIRSLSLRLMSLYQPSNLKIEALNGSTPQKIKGVQATIDSTGKAGDVLRRIQVRLPVVAGGMLPDYAIQSSSAICKHFATSATYFEISGVIDPDPGNPTCQPITDGAVSPCIAYNDVAFVLDNSGSMNDKWQTIKKIDKLKQVTTDFITNAAFLPDKNHGAIISFSDTGELRQGLTGDANALNAAVNGIQPDDDTKYLAGLTLAEQQLNGPNARPDAKKVIIFISDGEPKDNGRPGSITNKTDQLKASGIIIYTIGVANDLGSGKQILTDMAGNGGRFGDAGDEDALAGILRSVSLDLACQ